MRVDIIHSHLHQDNSSRPRPTRAERGAQDLRAGHWLICPADTLNSKSSSTGRGLASRFSVDPAAWHHDRIRPFAPKKDRHLCRTPCKVLVGLSSRQAAKRMRGRGARSSSPEITPAVWRTRTIDFDSRHNTIDSGVRTPGDRPGPGRYRILPVWSWFFSQQPGLAASRNGVLDVSSGKAGARDVARIEGIRSEPDGLAWDPKR